MLTDWLIVRRIAAELERELRGARIRAAGAAPDGRFGLRLPHGTLALDPFGPTPLVSLEPEIPLQRAPGWPRTIADAIEGLRIERIRARWGDRLLALDCAARSRFGVSNAYRLVVELTPRFGNIVLLKDETVVSAAKEFSRAENARRATRVGETYEPPPLPVPGVDADPLAAFAALVPGHAPDARQRAARALRGAVPLLPRLVAESLVAEAVTLDASPGSLLERSLDRARALVARADGEPVELGDVYVYVYADERQVVQVHVVPLYQFGALTERRERELLPVLAGVAGRQRRERAAGAFEARRATLRARVERRLAVLAAERTDLKRERDDARSTEALRSAGELLYAHVGEVPTGAQRFVPPSNPAVTIELDPTLDAKGNALAIFKRYKKSIARRAHLDERLASLERDAAYGDEVAWELARAEPETLEDLAEDVARLEHRKAYASRSERGRRQRALEVPLGLDARVYVGRSPRNNADLTFDLARPNDLWFHARATPGAHVVLQIDSRRAARDDELRAAAEFAAYHSKARSSEAVAVDYTERKYVRRRQGAPPGLVWYTNARTLLVAPRG